MSETGRALTDALDTARREAAQPPAPVPSMARRVLGGGGWNMAGQVLTLAASLVATPFVIRLLGPQFYGLFALINTLVGYVAFADLGMSVASSKFGADAHAKGDHGQEASVVWTSLVLAAVPSGVIAAALSIWAREIATDFLGLGPDLVGPATTALRVASIGFVARAISGVLNTPQIVRMRWDLSVSITSGGTILQILLAPVVLWLGGGLVTAVAVSTVVAVLTAFANLVVSTRLQRKLWPPSIRRSMVRPLMVFGGAMLLAYGAHIVLSNGDRVVVARLETISHVGFYAVSAAAAALLHIVPYALAGPMLPAFSILRTGGRADEARDLYVRLLRLLLITLTPAVVMIVVLARPFFVFWAGPLYADNSTVPFYILAVGVAFDAFTTVPANVMLAAHRAGSAAKYQLAQIVPYFALSIVLVIWFGIVGAAVAWTLRCVVNAGLFFWGVRTEFPGARGPAGVFSGGYVAAAILLVVPVAAVMLLPVPLPVTAAVCLIALGGYAFVVWRRVLAPDERSLVAEIGGRVRSTFSRG
ncbi:MAG: oligosaccharide flippase family protein [Actinomycetota bacterium]